MAILPPQITPGTVPLNLQLRPQPQLKTLQRIPFKDLAVGLYTVGKRIVHTCAWAILFSEIVLCCSFRPHSRYLSSFLSEYLIAYSFTIKYLSEHQNRRIYAKRQSKCMKLRYAKYVFSCIHQLLLKFFSYSLGKKVQLT